MHDRLQPAAQETESYSSSYSEELQRILIENGADLIRTGSAGRIPALEAELDDDDRWSNCAST